MQYALYVNAYSIEGLRYIIPLILIVFCVYTGIVHVFWEFHLGRSTTVGMFFFTAVLF